MRPVLETERLLLRQPGEDDLDALAAMYADAEVMRYIGDGQPVDRAESWKAIAGAIGHWELRGYGLFAYVERATGTVIGRGGLYNPEGWPGLEVGWLLARAAWGKGFATEAGAACIRWAFDDLRAETLISVIHPANAASIKVAGRLGGTFDRTEDLRGQPVSIYRYARSGVG